MSKVMSPNQITFGKCVNTKNSVRNFFSSKSNNKRSLKSNWKNWRMPETRGWREAVRWVKILLLRKRLMTTSERPSMPRLIHLWRKRPLPNASGLPQMLWENLTESWWRKRHLISIPIRNKKWRSVRLIWEMVCSKHNKTGSRIMTWKLKGI